MSNPVVYYLIGIRRDNHIEIIYENPIRKLVQLEIQECRLANKYLESSQRYYVRYFIHRHESKELPTKEFIEAKYRRLLSILG